MLSTHKVEIVPVTLTRHDNADSLSVVPVFDGGYTCVVRTQDWKDGDLAAYIPPDSLVPVDRPEFAFLDSGKGRSLERIKARKIRGVQSFGLLVPAPAGAQLGEDVADRLGVQHYEPDLCQGKTRTDGEAVAGPPLALSKYDIDSLRRYRNVFQNGEMVVVTEKIHGANSRYVFLDDQMYCGSRTEWKAQSENSLWWTLLKVHPEIERFCRAYPGCVLYGEAYGNVQSLKYGLGKQVRFMAFDILGTNGQFLPAMMARTILETEGVPQVPLLAYTAYEFDYMCSLAEGPSTVDGANHVREGCVVKPVAERWHQAVGRVILKLVGAGYLEKQ